MIDDTSSYRTKETPKSEPSKTNMLKQGFLYYLKFNYVDIPMHGSVGCTTI